MQHSLRLAGGVHLHVRTDTTGIKCGLALGYRCVDSGGSGGSGFHSPAYPTKKVPFPACIKANPQQRRLLGKTAHRRFFAAHGKSAGQARTLIKCLGSGL